MYEYLVVEEASRSASCVSCHGRTDHGGACARTLLKHLVFEHLRLDQDLMQRADQDALDVIQHNVVWVTAMRAVRPVALTLRLLLLFVVVIWCELHFYKFDKIIANLNTKFIQLKLSATKRQQRDACGRWTGQPDKKYVQKFLYFIFTILCFHF